jgi:hypothetical protein
VTTNKKDLGAGVIFLLIAAFFGIGALHNSLGTLSRMGPGMFPLLLSGVLALLGVIIIARAFGASGEKIRLLPVSAALPVLATPVVFAVTVRGLGLAPSIALVVLLGVIASRQIRPLPALALIAGLTLFCIAVFDWGLGLPLSPIGPWLGGR